MKILSILISSILLTSMLGCSSTPTKEGTGEYIDDSVITAKVKAAVLGDDALKVAEVNVETFKGTVQLSGFVGSQAVVDRAGVLARGVAGVKGVKNSLQVK